MKNISLLRSLKSHIQICFFKRNFVPRPTKYFDPKKHLSCQNNLPQPWRSFHCCWNTYTSGAFESMRFLPEFCGSNSWGVTPGQERASKVQSERNVGGIPKAEYTLFRITHKIIHEGMHSHIDLTNKYPIVFPIAHTDIVSHQSRVRRWTLELCGVVSRLLHCSCPPFSGPAYTLTRFSSHCCYYLGRFQVQTPPLPVLPWGTGA